MGCARGSPAAVRIWQRFAGGRKAPGRQSVGRGEETKPESLKKSLDAMQPLAAHAQLLKRPHPEERKEELLKLKFVCRH